MISPWLANQIKSTHCNPYSKPFVILEWETWRAPVNQSWLRHLCVFDEKLTAVTEAPKINWKDFVIKITYDIMMMISNSKTVWSYWIFHYIFHLIMSCVFFGSCKNKTLKRKTFLYFFLIQNRLMNLMAA